MKLRKSRPQARNNEKKARGAKAEKEKVWLALGAGIYLHKPSKTYYERPWLEQDGRKSRTYRSLKTGNLRQATELLAQRRGRAIDARLGKAENPYAKEGEAGLTLVVEVLEAYQKAGYPDRFLRPRENAKTKRGESNAVAKLLTYFKVERVGDLDQAVCDEYHHWRCEGKGRVGKGNGNRTVELELTTLSNALTWAARKKLVEGNPIERRARYRKAEEIRHCVEFMPEDAEELHQIVRFMFAKKKSQVLGFQALIEAYTGLRSEEVLMLRSDAGPRQPGWISLDGKHLHVWRVKRQHKNNPYVVIRPGLRGALNALFRWKGTNYPDSPWYFPSPYNRDKTVDVSSLGHRLADYCDQILNASQKEDSKKERKEPSDRKHDPEQLDAEPADIITSRQIASEGAKEPRKLTSHGLRAWYVTLRRSHDVSDAQIAYEIGHTSGGRTLAEVYGGIPTNWLEEGGPKMNWLPKEPAWRVLGYDDTAVIPALAQPSSREAEVD